MTATEIASLLAQQAESVCRHLLPNGQRKGRQWFVGSVYGEPGNSMQVTLEGSKQGVWCDFAGSADDRGDMIGLWRKARNISLEKACREALDWMNVPHEERNRNNQRPIIKKPEPKAPDQRWLELQQTMRTGTSQELRALAELRKLPVIAGLELATHHGQLWFGYVHDSNERHHAWILTDGSRRNAQARKMDGSQWLFGGNRKPAKSKTIWGTDTHWPVGISEANTDEIAFVEGGPDFLAAWHLIWLTEKTATTRPVAMFGVSNYIHHEARPLFTNKKIWMFPHNEEKGTGLVAAHKWKDQLVESGSGPVNFYDFSKDGVKDLNEMVTAEGLPEEAIA